MTFLPPFSLPPLYSPAPFDPWTGRKPRRPHGSTAGFDLRAKTNCICAGLLRGNPLSVSARASLDGPGGNEVAYKVVKRARKNARLALALDDKIKSMAQAWRDRDGGGR